MYRHYSLTMFFLLTACGRPNNQLEKDRVTDPQGQHYYASDFDKIARGGRLYDKWTAETGVEHPPSLEDGSGNKITNKAKHGFRCKNCHGWDYKGDTGIYGPAFKNKKYAVAVDLNHSRKRGDLATIIRDGGDGMPAFGKVLSASDIDALVAFISQGIYDTDAVFSRTTKTKSKYKLNLSGNADAGMIKYRQSCQECHGENGLKVMISDGAYSLGSHARLKGYEDHHKLVYGDPGSEMKSHRFNATEILDVLTALCNNLVFPSAGSKANLSDELQQCP